MMALMDNTHVSHVIKPFSVPQILFLPCLQRDHSSFLLMSYFCLLTPHTHFVAIIVFSFRLTCIPRLKVTLIFHSGSGDVIDGKEKDLGFMVMNALAVLLSGTGSANAGKLLMLC